MASLGEDVAREILLHLPLKPLLRFRTACKFWRDIIDSTCFKQSHIHRHANNNNNDNDEYDAVAVLKLRVLLEHELIPGQNYISIGYKNLMICSLIQDLPEIPVPEADRLVTVPGRIVVESVADSAPTIVGPVKGLFCIYYHNCRYSKYNRAISVYNPGLDIIKELPDGYPDCSCLLPDRWGAIHGLERHVSIGYDNIAHDYKVLQLLSSYRCRHALLYSKKTNSWRELACHDYNFFYEQNFRIRESIKSLCTDSTAYWVASHGWPNNMKGFILFFNIKSEVFGILEMPDFVSVSFPRLTKTFVKPDKFVLLYDHMRNEESGKWFSIYEAKIEDNEILHWDLVGELPRLTNHLPVSWSLWRNDYVVLKYNHPDCAVLKDNSPKELVFYDYCQNKVVRRVLLPDFSFKEFDILRYEGSFITP